MCVGQFAAWWKIELKEKGAELERKMREVQVRLRGLSWRPVDTARPPILARHTPFSAAVRLRKPDGATSVRVTVRCAGLKNPHFFRRRR